MVDGLASELGDVAADSVFSGADISGAQIATQGVGTTQLADTGVTNAKLANNSVSGTRVSAEFGPVGTGSPTVFGLSLQTGEYVTTSTNSVTVSFGTAFEAAPLVYLTPFGLGSTGTSIAVSSVTTTTFLATTSDNSQSGTWLAVGSGRL